jgi:hypothetical protein
MAEIYILMLHPQCGPRETFKLQFCVPAVKVDAYRDLNGCNNIWPISLHTPCGNSKVMLHYSIQIYIERNFTVAFNNSNCINAHV